MGHKIAGPMQQFREHPQGLTTQTEPDSPSPQLTRAEVQFEFVGAKHRVRSVRGWPDHLNVSSPRAILR